MAINQNHLFEELDGIKCAIVEKNASRDRVEFLCQLLTYNLYKVIVVTSPPPKTAPARPVPAASPGMLVDEPEQILPETFTVGVTDVTFNPTNAIFGRLLKLPGGHIVSLAFWLQQETVSHDERPYFES